MANLATLNKEAASRFSEWEKTVEDTQTSIRNAQKKALVSCYKFAMACQEDTDGFAALRKSLGVSPHKSGATVFTDIVKCCFGHEVFDGKTGETLWLPRGDSFVSKYAAILDHAYNAMELESAQFSKWIAKNSATKLYGEIAGAKSKNSSPLTDDQRARLTGHEAGTIANGISLAPTDERYGMLFYERADDGRLTVWQADVPKDQIAKSLSGYIEPAGDISKLALAATLSGVLQNSRRDKRAINFQNTNDGFSASMSNVDCDASVMATITTNDACDLAPGKQASWSGDEIDGFQWLASRFKDQDWRIDKQGDKAAVQVSSPVFDTTEEMWNHREDQKKLSTLSRNKEYKPSRYELPKGVVNHSDAYHVPYGARASVHRPSEAKWSVARVIAVKELKNLAKALMAVKSGALEFTNKYNDLVIKTPDGSQDFKIAAKIPGFNGMPIRVADFLRILKTLSKFNAPASLSVNGHGIRFELERQDMACSVVVPAFRNKKLVTELNAR